MASLNRLCVVKFQWNKKKCSFSGRFNRPCRNSLYRSPSALTTVILHPDHRDSSHRGTDDEIVDLHHQGNERRLVDTNRICALLLLLVLLVLRLLFPLRRVGNIISRNKNSGWRYRHRSPPVPTSHLRSRGVPDDANRGKEAWAFFVEAPSDLVPDGVVLDVALRDCRALFALQEEAEVFRRSPFLRRKVNRACTRVRLS